MSALSRDRININGCETESKNELYFCASDLKETDKAYYIFAWETRLRMESKIRGEGKTREELVHGQCYAL